MVDYDNVLVVSSDMMEYWCSANIPPRPLVDLRKRNEKEKEKKKKEQSEERILFFCVY
jgi:hypothetical protein